MYTSEEQMPDKYSLFHTMQEEKKNKTKEKISWYEGYKTTSTANNIQIYTLGDQLLCTQLINSSSQHTEAKRHWILCKSPIFVQT